MKDEILKKYNKKKSIKLMLSVIIDLVGLLSYGIPGFAEWSDAVWAPISGFMIYLLYPNRKKMALAGVIEEAMPFIDFIPTAYLTWRKEYINDRDNTLRKFTENEVKEQNIVDKKLNEIDINRDEI